MRRIFSCSSSQVALERWNRQDQKLLEAVRRGDVGRVAALASRKTARPTKLDVHGQSPFHVAASKGLTECLTVLLANGAEINTKNEDGSTALHLATISCQPQCVKVLLQHGANEDAVDGENRSPLHWAASSGCASSVLLLCDHEAFLDVLDNDGRTPLMIASLGGHSAICSQLLQRGARVNVTDKEDKSALILACEKGSAEVAELLLSHGADVGAVDRLGRNALHYALHTDDKALQRLLRQALNRRRRGGQLLVKHSDMVVQASVTEPQVGPQIQSPGRAEEEEEEDEEEEEEEEEEAARVEGWRQKFEAERKKVCQLEGELARAAEECATQVAGAGRDLEERIREQARALELLLPAASGGGPGPGPRPGGDGMEEGCALDLLAQRVLELKRRQELLSFRGPPQNPPQTEQGPQSPAQRGPQGPAEQGPQSPAEDAPPSPATREELKPLPAQAPEARSSPAAEDPSRDRPEAQAAAPGAPGAEPAGMAALSQLLLQLREELGAVWREKEAARGALDRPGPEAGRDGREVRAEAAAAAWEKMEARLERVLARLDRAKAGLQREAGPGPGGPGSEVPGAEARGLLEREVSALRQSNSSLLDELGALGGERRRLREELQALRRRLQREFVPRPEAQGQLRQLRLSVDLLAEELAAEKEATDRLRRRLAAQSSGLRGLRDHLPPDLVAGPDAGPDGEPVEELRRGLAALAGRHREARAQLARLQEENRGLRAGRGPTPPPPAAPAAPAAPEVAALERDLGQLEGELRAVQATLGGKGQEIGRLKRLLCQATEEVAELRAREEAGRGRHERARAALAAQAQARGRELEALLAKYRAACRDGGRLRAQVAEERRRAGELEAREARRRGEAAQLRARSDQLEKAAGELRARLEELWGACGDKEAQIRELLKKVEELSAEVLALRGENGSLKMQLQNSQKNHQEIIATYRTHLLDAARGCLEEEVYEILLRILEMQEEE
ncbi:LOW QUALITY PROTEIN: ankyrin repeat domain-containing protein 35 [Tachyglossus aculeatus]|uniref:LOW QUALITY PROTEIN: ankyrin repeat domain-containing protein 35 n=1 Tax=Tachyglossus aculeatus TaxID=9261 RepID=UPI0018F2C2F3|nr:LOW QUALITY PROTEIN: ankyrin repeat domain-containing protein 35 [Tachyglossus aculeatus]